MTGRAIAIKDEPGVTAEPALKTGIEEGMAVGAGCWMNGVEWTGTAAGGEYRGIGAWVGMEMGVV
jgi:hypothetical protein